MKNRLLILALYLFCAVPAFSQGMTKAQELRNHIETSISGTKDVDRGHPISDTVRSVIENTSSYVVGMADAWNSDNPGFVPNNVGWLELMGVVQRYIDAHPEKLQDKAASVAKLAVIEAYHSNKKVKR